MFEGGDLVWGIECGLVFLDYKVFVEKVGENELELMGFCRKYQELISQVWIYLIG